LGGEGDDTLSGGGSNDQLLGGAGADVYQFDADPGAANADSVTGFESGFDRILLTQHYWALGSEGTFSTEDARFWASASGSAHDADDRIIYNTGTGQLWYDGDGNGSSAGQLIATLGVGVALAASDISLETISSPNQTVTGTSGNDTLAGGSGNDTVLGLAGNDYLEGGGGQDSVVGGDGNDTLWGSDPDHGILYEWEAADTLDGGYGDDVYNVRGDNDDRTDTIVQDPGGIDTVIAHMTNWTLAAGLENLYYVDYRGTGFHGIGNELDNIISGGGAEGSYLFGLRGNDLLIAGSWGSAQLEGGDGNDTLLGAGHGDYLFGGAGDDLLDGGAFGFEDGLEGGTGADTFVFVGDDGGPATVIIDFASGADTIRLDGFDLSGYGFGDIGPSGRLAAGDGRFWASSSGTAHDSSDRIIYNTTTGELWYDADGNGAEAARTIVQLQGTPTLVATDLEVVNGSPSPRAVYGTWGDDSLVGGAGDDFWWRS
jgi:serralysin